MLPALRQACGPAESGCRVVSQRIVHGLREDTCCAILVLEGSRGGDQKDSVGSTSNLDLTKTQHHLSPQTERHQCRTGSAHLFVPLT